MKKGKEEKIQINTKTWKGKINKKKGKRKKGKKTKNQKLLRLTLHETPKSKKFCNMHKVKI